MKKANYIKSLLEGLYHLAEFLIKQLSIDTIEVKACSEIERHLNVHDFIDDSAVDIG